MFSFYKFLLLGLFLLVSRPGWSVSLDHKGIRAYISKTHKKYKYPQKTLESLFQKAKWRPKVIKLMDQPYERKPWKEYEKRLVSQNRIKKGSQFWSLHKTSLLKASSRYSVPPEIIVAIIGVESNYGKFLKTYPAFDTLMTLAFKYPRRAEFFKKELTSLLLLIRDKGLEKNQLFGSYAGALGLPQFMPSNYRRLAVDGNNDQKVDLFEPDDAIFSVAHYLSHHGWKKNEPFVSRRYPKNVKIKKVATTRSQIQKVTKKKFGRTTIRLKSQNSSEYHEVGYNFYVILKYNNSFSYAAAISNLAKKIKEKS